MGNCCIKSIENIKPSRTGAVVTNPVEKYPEQNKKSVEIVSVDNPFSPDQEDFVHV